MTGSLPSKPTSIRYLVLAWACSLSMITYIDRVCIKQVEGQISADLGLTSQQFAWVFAAFALSYSLFEVPSGWLGDRMGPRRVLMRIVLWWSVFTALTGYIYKFEWTLSLGLFTLTITSFGWLVAVRFLFGMGEAGAYPNIARALRSWFPYQRRGFAQGLMWMFARWGGAVAAPLIALFSMTYLGWRGAFYLFGIMGIVWVLFFWYFFRDTPIQHPAVNDAEKLVCLGKAGVPTLAVDFRPMLPYALAYVAAAIAFGGLSWLLDWPLTVTVPTIIGSLWLILISVSLVVQSRTEREIPPTLAEGQIRPAIPLEKPAPISWRHMLASPTLWFLSVMYFCSNAGWCFFITWDARYYKQELGLSGNALMIALGAPLFFGGIACLSGGLTTDRMVRVLGPRWGRTLQGFIAYFLGGVFFLLALWVHDPLWTVVFLCIASFLKDMAMGVSWATCIDIGHRYSGTVSGFMNMIGNMGTVVGPIAVAALATPEGQPERWYLALTFSAIMFFIASLGWAFIDPRRVIVYAPGDEPHD